MVAQLARTVQAAQAIQVAQVGLQMQVQAVLAAFGQVDMALDNQAVLALNGIVRTAAVVARLAVAVVLAHRLVVLVATMVAVLVARQMAVPRWALAVLALSSSPTPQWWPWRAPATS